MENVNVVLRVHKVHKKRNGAYTVGVVIEKSNELGMKLTEYASVKFTKRPQQGQQIKAKNVVTELNKEGFSWIKSLELV